MNLQVHLPGYAPSGRRVEGSITPESQDKLQQAADLLLPAIAAVDSIQAAMSGGVLRDLSDYDTIHRLLQPHFRGREILE
ncbi:hypothetical protein AK812_SmicGene46100, partial [Symbiodinium microadriaticum]